MYRCCEASRVRFDSSRAAASSQIPPFLQSRSSQISPSHPEDTWFPPVPLSPSAPGLCSVRLPPARRRGRGWARRGWLGFTLPQLEAAQSGGCTAATILSSPPPCPPDLTSQEQPSEVDPRSSPWGMPSGSQRAGPWTARACPAVQGLGWDLL